MNYPGCRSGCLGLTVEGYFKGIIEFVWDIIVFFDPKTRKYKAIVSGAREEDLALKLLYARQLGS
jgi:hypothetical protein